MRDAASPSSPVRTAWRVRLFGGLGATCGNLVIGRFPSRAVAALCARLAMYPDRGHGREELAELLWPGASRAASANRLRNALSTLKRLLSTPALSGHAVILSDRRTLRVNPTLLTSDVAQFDQLLAAGRLHEASSYYRGELMPGFYDEWILDERHRVIAAYARVRKQLSMTAPVAAGATPTPAGLAAEPGALRPLWRCTPRLPDSFFGREREVAVLAATLRSARLVVIRGPAGAGKSRLALEFAGATVDFDLVAWVPLLPCAEPEQALEHVRGALWLERTPGLPLDQIATRLDGRRALLVLDNLEHLLLDGRAPFIAELLGRVSDLRIVATSQRRLAGQRARDLALTPLALPTIDADLAATARSPAVRLFVDRARLRRADFTLHVGNAVAVAAICRLVQGLPLALELAAAQVRKMPLRAIGNSLDAAAGHAVAAAQPRHASMAQALRWSWQLTSTEQQRDLGLLSELRGNFNPQFAGPMLGTSAARAAARLHTLARMSWLQAAAPQPAHWSMLAVVRQFAQQHTAPALTDLARSRHRRLFLDRARAFAAAGRALPAAELPDHLHAIEGALADGTVTAADHALALRGHFISQGASASALALLGRLTQANTLDSEHRCQIAALLAPLLLEAGRTKEAQKLATDTRARADELAARARVDAEIAWVDVMWRSERAGMRVIVPAREALTQAHALGDDALIGRAALLLGAIVWAHEKDNAQARALFETAEAAFRRAGDPRAAAAALPGHAVCLILNGDLQAAVDMCEAGIALARRHDDVQTEVLLLNRLGEACAQLRRNGAAARAGRRLVDLAARHGLAYHLAYGLWNLALPLARLGRSEEAARVLAFSHRYWSEHFGGLGKDDGCYVERVRDGVARRIGARRWNALWRDGMQLSVDAAVALALGPAHRREQSEEEDQPAFND